MKRITQEFRCQRTEGAVYQRSRVTLVCHLVANCSAEGWYKRGKNNNKLVSDLYLKPETNLKQNVCEGITLKDHDVRLSAV